MVFPALITAGEWLTRVVAPLLPGDLVAEVARYSAIACSVIALVSLGRLSPGAASPEANTTFGMLHSRTLARSLRLTIGVSGVVLSVLGLASSDTTMLPASAFLFSTVVVARLLFELHPACNGEIWITPDVDQAATNEGTTLSKYSLADAIVSGRMVGPTLGGTLLAAIFLGTMAGAGAFMFDRPNANDTLAFAIALLSIQTIGFTVFALAARRIVLGTWILRTSPRYSRHVFFDLLSGGIAASIALLIFSTRDLHTSPVAAFIPFAMTAAVSSFLLISALGLRPFARPRAKHGTLRANLAIPLLIAITSFFGVTSVAVAAKQLSPLWKTGLLIAAFCLQYAASCAFVPLDQSLALRDQFRGAAKGVWSAKKRLLPAVTILLIAVSGIVGNFGLRGGDEDLLIATSCSLLIWPLFRWFGAVPLIEELKARETDTTVVTKPVAPWWTYLDTPWWATIILSGLLLPHWEAAGLPQWVELEHVVCGPADLYCVCVSLRHRRCLAGGGRTFAPRDNDFRIHLRSAWKPRLCGRDVVLGSLRGGPRTTTVPAGARDAPPPRSANAGVRIILHSLHILGGLVRLSIRSGLAGHDGRPSDRLVPHAGLALSAAACRVDDCSRGYRPYLLSLGTSTSSWTSRWSACSPNRCKPAIWLALDDSCCCCPGDVADANLFEKVDDR